jgi:hypothetical protein
MQKQFILLFIIIISIPVLNCQSLITAFEKNNKTTTTYAECISFYKQLAKSSKKWIKLIEAGPSDAGYPIHLVVISNKNHNTPEKTRKAGKVVLMINNGIHPGEPDGIDAAMLFAKELISDETKRSILDDVTIIIIPVYNIGGSLNRNQFTRVNQNGPLEYGFRANGQNLDLNRDFIKCDSKNAETFTKIFHSWDPDVFLDTHCTDGADYPYVMTLITSQRQKLEKQLGDFVFTKFAPAFYERMKEDGVEMSPYVNTEGDLMNGIYDYMDLPRLSSGYAALYHSIPFVSESHMLKSFDARVNAQKILMKNLAVLTSRNKKEIIEMRNQAKFNYKNMTELPVSWKLQTQLKDSIWFKSYGVDKFKSEITGNERIRYNTSKVSEKKIPYYNNSKPEINIKRPYAYIVPAAYHEVVDRLKWNGVQMQVLENDSIIQAEFYKITDYKTTERPYENHYLHSGVQIQPLKLSRKYFKGDYIIKAEQANIRYLTETLEPQAPDSYFAWNFFDGILQRKEYFSAYLFEELAPDILKNDYALQNEFEKKKHIDPEFSKDPDAMLYFIYAHSKYSETGYMIYPVGRYFEE